MRITCVGGGPAGLYFALLMKKADPAHQVRVLERNRAGDTFGGGFAFGFVRHSANIAARDDLTPANRDQVEVSQRSAPRPPAHGAPGGEADAGLTEQGARGDVE